VKKRIALLLAAPAVIVGLVACNPNTLTGQNQPQQRPQQQYMYWCQEHVNGGVDWGHSCQWEKVPAPPSN
jgi:hypothetical protein